jgi:hypothetical protein
MLAGCRLTSLRSWLVQACPGRWRAGRLNPSWMAGGPGSGRC